MSRNFNKKIVIIGCGISGIAAAEKLVKAGYRHVRILEATSRSGGRIKTGKLGEQFSVIPFPLTADHSDKVCS